MMGTNGSFGVVYKGVWKPLHLRNAGRPVALKVRMYGAAQVVA